MKVFGYDLPDMERVATPIGSICSHCEEAVMEGDCGEIVPHLGATVEERPVHLECLLRKVFGSVAHQERRCSCYGGGESCEDSSKTRRQQAREAALMGLRSTGREWPPAL